MRNEMTMFAIALSIGLIAGGFTGWSLRGDGSRKALEAQTETIESLQEGQATLLEVAQQPVVLDASLKATLAETPPTCIREMGGEPLSPQCLLTLCWAHGTSSAQRPSCEAVERLVVQNGTSSKSLTDR
jgi:hypothetical protein